MKICFLIGRHVIVSEIPGEGTNQRREGQEDVGLRAAGKEVALFHFSLAIVLIRSVVTATGQPLTYLWDTNFFSVVRSNFVIWAVMTVLALTGLCLTPGPAVSCGGWNRIHVVFRHCCVQVLIILLPVNCVDVFQNKQFPHSRTFINFYNLNHFNIPFSFEFCSDDLQSEFSSSTDLFPSSPEKQSNEKAAPLNS